MTLAFAVFLDFTTRAINSSAQKIDNSFLETDGIISTEFSIQKV